VRLERVLSEIKCGRLEKSTAHVEKEVLEQATGLFGQIAWQRQVQRELKVLTSHVWFRLPYADEEELLDLSDQLLVARATAEEGPGTGNACEYADRLMERMQARITMAQGIRTENIEQLVEGIEHAQQLALDTKVARRALAELMRQHSPQLCPDTPAFVEEVVPSGLVAGSRVFVGEDAGCVRFVGALAFARGTWIGIDFDEPRGTCDGTFHGSRLFRCRPGHGKLVRPNAVRFTPFVGRRRLSPVAARETRRKPYVASLPSQVMPQGSPDSGAAGALELVEAPPRRARKKGVRQASPSSNPAAPSKTGVVGASMFAERMQLEAVACAKAPCNAVRQAPTAQTAGAGARSGAKLVSTQLAVNLHVPAWPPVAEVPRSPSSAHAALGVESADSIRLQTKPASASAMDAQRAPEPAATSSGARSHLAPKGPAALESKAPTPTPQPRALAPASTRLDGALRGLPSSAVSAAQPSSLSTLAPGAERPDSVPGAPVAGASADAADAAPIVPGTSAVAGQPSSKSSMSARKASRPDVVPGAPVAGAPAHATDAAPSAPAPSAVSAQLSPKSSTSAAKASRPGSVPEAPAAGTSANSTDSVPITPIPSVVAAEASSKSSMPLPAAGVSPVAAVSAHSTAPRPASPRTDAAPRPPADGAPAPAARTDAETPMPPPFAARLDAAQAVVSASTAQPPPHPSAVAPTSALADGTLGVPLTVASALAAPPTSQSSTAAVAARADGAPGVVGALAEVALPSRSRGTELAAASNMGGNARKPSAVSAASLSTRRF